MNLSSCAIQANIPRGTAYNIHRLIFGRLHTKKFFYRVNMGGLDSSGAPRPGMPAGILESWTPTNGGLKSWKILDTHKSVPILDTYNGDVDGDVETHKWRFEILES